MTYQDAITATNLRLADAVVSFTELLDAWTSAVRAASGRQDVSVWADPEEINPWIVFESIRGEICLEPWEADLIEGVMTPEAYLLSNGRVLQ